MVARERQGRRGARGFNELVAGDLKRKEYRPVYVLVGEDDFRMDAIVEHMRRDVLGEGPNAAFNDHAFRGDESPLALALQQARSYPMLGGRQLVRLRDAQAAVTDDAAGDALLAYVNDPTEQTVLVLTATKLDKRRRWVKACQAAGVLYEIEPPAGSALLDWIAKAAGRAGLQLDGEGVNLLAELVGGDLRALSGEIDKLALLAEQRGRGPTSEEIVGVVVDQAELEVFAINRNLVPGGAAAALANWYHLSEWGNNAHALAPVMLYKLKAAALAAAVAADGVPEAEIPGVTGLNPWVYRTQIRPLVAEVGLAGLVKALREGLRCDRNLKSSPLGPDLALERFILAVCGIAD